ncbi:hypothetical protein [uncultured Mucilaginibacter sp.]|nr:hypothetical protein [uncultured Mucilaginibacter sp.]
METITTIENNSTQVKENWSKPEINIISVNEETLGSGTNGSDSMNGS